MSIARRDLLGLGAALAVSITSSACRSSGEPAPLPSPLQPSVNVPSEVPERGEATFPGSPPPGSLYLGASVPHYRSVSQWERQLGTRLAVHRSYFTPQRNRDEQLLRQCRADIVAGRLPHVSLKPPATWGELASGAWDPWLRELLTPLGDLGGQVFFTLHHEPENDAGPPGMAAVDFRAMQRRLLELADRSAPQVVVVPVLQQWTFDPIRVDIDPGQWIVAEAPVQGLDVYNPWSPTNNKVWRSFASKCDEALSWFGDVPVAIGEFGCRIDPTNPGLAAAWLHDAVDYAREHRIVSMSYFNSPLNAPDGTWELSGETERAFAELLASDWVARPS